MKKLVWILMLFGILLTGCGKEQQPKEVRLPYLTSEERAELEQGLVSSLRFTVLEDITPAYTYYRMQTELENVSEYQLSDISVSYTLNGEEVFSLDGLPPHTEYVHKEICEQSEEKWRAYAGEMEYRYDISYTIGEFNYLISDCRILPEDRAEKAIEMRIEIKTDQGPVMLCVPGSETVEIEGAVEGLQTVEIHSVSEGDQAKTYHVYNSSTGCFRGLSLQFTGKAPKGRYIGIVYRLKDEEGKIRDTGTISLYGDDTADLYSYSYLEPGNYVLEFEEDA